MHKSKSIVHILTLVLFLLAFFPAKLGVSPAHAAGLTQPGVSVAQYLSANGTLRLGTGYNGNLSVAGFGVSLDPKLGPVFKPAQSGGTWTALGTSPLSANVQSIAVIGTDVYVGGDFIDAGGDANGDKIAMWDGSSWHSLEGGAENTVYAMAVSGTDLYVGGGFKYVMDAGQVAIPNTGYVAKWNSLTSSWSALGTGRQEFVNAVTVNGTDTYFGGYFDFGSPTPDTIYYLARWSGSAWSTVVNQPPVTPPMNTLQLNDIVYALAVSGTDLYVGGDFTSAGGIAGADRIARWDGLAWHSLGAGSGLNNSVYAIALTPTDIYAGGIFINAGSDPHASYIARWDGSAWHALGSSTLNVGIHDHIPHQVGDPSLVYGVAAITAAGTDIYVGGDFTDAGGLSTADYIAKWDGSAWSAISGGLNGRTTAITIHQQDVFVGGYFTDADGAVPGDADWIASIEPDLIPPTFDSLVHTDTLISTGPAVHYLLTFSEPVSGVDASDFTLSAPGLTGAAITNISGSGSTRIITVGTGGGNSTSPIILTLNNNGSIIDNLSNVLDMGSSYTTPPADQYTIDNPPCLCSNIRMDPSPTSATTLHFSVSFTEPVTGVTIADFHLTTAGIAGASITGISGGPTTYTVTVNAGIGNGTIRLDAPLGGTITDSTAHAVSNLPYSSGQVYTISRSYTATLNSLGGQDGWILETKELSSLGGSLSAKATTLKLGDDSLRRQYRSILAFSTGPALPDNAIITSVNLRFRRNLVTGGGNPISLLKGLLADIKTGIFGSRSTLEAADFQARTTKTLGPFFPVALSSWYTVDLSAASTSINKLTTAGGLTQVRLRFKLDDNNNPIANTLIIYSGNAPVANRPQLVITYYIP